MSVKDEKSEEEIATCSIRLATLLDENDLTVDRGFELNCLKGNFGSSSPKIYMKLSLKVIF